MTSKMSATKIAKIILINLHRYNLITSRDRSRFIITKKLLREISGRALFKEVFIEDLCEEFSLLGWHFFVHSDTQFALLRKSGINSWTQIGLERVKELLELDDDAVDAEYYKVYPVKPSDDDIELEPNKFDC